MDLRIGARTLTTLAAVLAAGSLGAVAAVADPGNGSGEGNGYGYGIEKDKTDTTTVPVETPVPTVEPTPVPELPGETEELPAGERPEHPEHPDHPEQANDDKDKGDKDKDKEKPNGGKLPPAAPPAVGKQVKVGVKAGKIVVRLPGGTTDVPLEDPASLPVGSVIDAREGTVELSSAADAAGATQTAAFRGGRFSVTQRTGAKPVTDLQMRGGDFASCGKSTAARSASRAREGVVAHAAAAPKKVRAVWGSGKGRFRTKGRHSAATVRGTVWEVIDRCDGTLTKVSRGVVEVRDVARKKTVIVKKGKSYLAKRK